MKIKLHAYRHIRADNLANTVQQVAFAVVVAVSSHRTMEKHLHGVERHSSPYVPEDRITQLLVYGANGTPGGLAKGA